MKRKAEMCAEFKVNAISLDGRVHNPCWTKYATNIVSARDVSGTKRGHSFDMIIGTAVAFFISR
jgi:hypothetical protein